MALSSRACWSRWCAPPRWCCSPICWPTAAKVSEMTLEREMSCCSACATCSLSFWPIVTAPAADASASSGMGVDAHHLPPGRRRPAASSAMVGVSSMARAGVELGRGLLGAGDDALLGFTERADALCVFADRDRAVVDLAARRCSASSKRLLTSTARADRICVVSSTRGPQPAGRRRRRRCRSRQRGRKQACRLADAV